MLKEILAEGRYDVVHVNMLSAANILPLRLAQEAGVGKVIAHSHNASAPGMLRRILDQWNRPKISRYADVLVKRPEDGCLEIRLMNRDKWFCFPMRLT